MKRIRQLFGDATVDFSSGAPEIQKDYPSSSESPEKVKKDAPAFVAGTVPRPPPTPKSPERIQRREARARHRRRAPKSPPIEAPPPAPVPVPSQRLRASAKRRKSTKKSSDIDRAAPRTKTTARINNAPARASRPGPSDLRRSKSRTDLDSNGDEILDEAPSKTANRQKNIERREKRRPNAGSSSGIDRPARRGKDRKNEDVRRPSRRNEEAQRSPVSKKALEIREKAERRREIAHRRKVNGHPRAPRITDSDEDDVGIAPASKKRPRHLFDSKQAAKRRRSAAVKALAPISIAPARPVRKENPVTPPRPKDETPLTMAQRVSMSETALCGFAIDKAPLPLDGMLTSIEGVRIDPIPIVDWLAVLFLAHYRAAKVHLYDLESLMDQIAVNTRYHWNSVCQKHGLSNLPFLESPNDVARMFLKIGEAISSEYKRGEGRFIDSWYSHENICKYALDFLFMVLQLWQYYFDMNKADDRLAPDSDTLDRLFLGVKMLLCLELDPIGPHWYVFEDVHIPRMAVWNLSKDGKEGIGRLLDVCCSYTESMENKGSRVRKVSEIGEWVVFHLGILCQPAGSTLPHLRGVWNVYHPYVSAAIDKFFESSSWSNFFVRLAYNFRMRKSHSAHWNMAVCVSALSMMLKNNMVSKTIILPGHSDELELTLTSAVVHLKAAASSPLEYVSSVYKYDDLHLDIATEVDVIKAILSTATVQSRLLRYDKESVRAPFLPAVEDLILNVASMCPVQPFPNHAMLADMCAIGFKGVRIPSGVKNTDYNPRNFQRAIALVMSIVGNFVKSFASGKRRILANNTLREMLKSRTRHKRRLGYLLDAFYRIQQSAERFVNDEELCSEEEHNGFVMAMELIRLEVVADDQSRRKGKTVTAQHIAEQLMGGAAEDDSVASVTSADEQHGKVKWPSVLSSKELVNVVAETGHRNFDDDPSILLCVASSLTRGAEDDLARYDSTFKKPARWTRLKRNEYVGDARSLLEREHKIVPGRCKCLPGRVTRGYNNDGVACSSGMCANVATKYECDPKKCPVGKECRNQQMQRDSGPSFKTVNFGAKGIGLVAEEVIEPHQYVGEYRGEVVTAEEFKRREALYVGERHFYAMTLTSKLTIDASRKSAITRFINHSCDPNCEAQKWVAGGEPRVALFATRRIEKGDEVTFDYSALSGGLKAKACLCGTPKCRKTLTRSRGDDVSQAAPVPLAKLKKARDVLKEAERMREKAGSVKVGDKMDSNDPTFIKWKAKYRAHIPDYTKGTKFRIPRISVEAAKAAAAAATPIKPIVPKVTIPPPHFTRFTLNARGPNRFGPVLTQDQAAALNKPRPPAKDLDWGPKNPGKTLESSSPKQSENAVKPWKPKRAPGQKRLFQLTKADYEAGRVVAAGPPVRYDSDYSEVSETVPYVSDWIPMEIDSDCGAGTDDEFQAAPPIEVVVASGRASRARAESPRSPIFNVDPYPHQPPLQAHQGHRNAMPGQHRDHHPRPAPQHHGRGHGPGPHERHQWERGEHHKPPHQHHGRNDGHPQHDARHWGRDPQQHMQHHKHGQDNGPRPHDGRNWERGHYPQPHQHRHSRGQGPDLHDRRIRERGTYHQGQSHYGRHAPGPHDRRHAPGPHDRRPVPGPHDRRHLEREGHQQAPPQYHGGDNDNDRRHPPGPHDRHHLERERHQQAPPHYQGGDNGNPPRGPYHRGGENLNYRHNDRGSQRYPLPEGGRRPYERHRDPHARGVPAPAPNSRPSIPPGYAREHNRGAPISTSAPLQSRSEAAVRNGRNAGAPAPAPNAPRSIPPGYAREQNRIPSIPTSAPVPSRSAAPVRDDRNASAPAPAPNAPRSIPPGYAREQNRIPPIPTSAPVPSRSAAPVRDGRNASAPAPAPSAPPSIPPGYAREQNRVPPIPTSAPAPLRSAVSVRDGPSAGAPDRLPRDTNRVPPIPTSAPLPSSSVAPARQGDNIAAPGLLSAPPPAKSALPVRNANNCGPPSRPPSPPLPPPGNQEVQDQSKRGAPGPSSSSPPPKIEEETKTVNPIKRSSHPISSNSPPQRGRELVRDPTSRSRRFITSKSPPPRGREPFRDPTNDRSRRFVTSKSPPPRGRDPLRHPTKHHSRRFNRSESPPRRGREAERDSKSLRGARDNIPKSPTHRGWGPGRAPTNLRSARFVTPPHRDLEPVRDTTDQRDDDAKNRGAPGASALQHPPTNPPAREVSMAVEPKERETALPAQEQSLSGPSSAAGIVQPPGIPPRKLDAHPSDAPRSGPSRERFAHSSSRRRSSGDPPSKGPGSHRSKAPSRSQHRRSTIGASSQDPLKKSRQDDLRHLLNGRK